MSGQPDFKGPVRLVADQDQWSSILREKVWNQPCRVTGEIMLVDESGEWVGGPKVDGAHIVSRGQRGDDVAANIVPVRHDLHMAIEDHSLGWEEYASAVRHSFTPLELAYARAKKGKWWLDRRWPLHGVNGKVCAKCRKPLTDSNLEPRKTKDWTLTVPDDQEDGRDVLDALSDGLAEDLGYRNKSSRLRRYHAVVRALVFATVNRDQFIKEERAA